MTLQKLHQKRKPFFMKRSYRKYIADFYNKVDKVWPNNDKWHIYTQSMISKFVYKKVKNYDLPKQPLILNAGSGGITYHLPNEMYHLDIAENKINHFSKWFVGSVDKLPFKDNTFDICICVGTVINYCNAKKSIKELSRVLKPNGKLILEFENSYSLEFLFSQHFGKSKTLVKNKYFGQEHTYWIYSYPYILYLLNKNHFTVNEVQYIHILSSLLYRFIPIENIAYKACFFDKSLQHTKLSKFSCNILLEVTKTNDGL